MSCVTRYSGSDSKKILPYCIRWMRLSRMASTPRSVLERMSRPKPCFNARTAPGTWYSAKALRPSSFNALTRAATTGSEGTANGKRSTITQESCAPGTSTPCQKLAVANKTALKEERSEEHTSELQSQSKLVCRLLLEKKTNPINPG